MPSRISFRNRQCHSFTLIELLAVVSIVAILTVISITSFRYLTERDLDNAASIVEGIVDQGRSEAIARSTVVELCLATGTASSDTAPYRALSLWAYDQSSGTYTQISRWAHLPNSVQVASVENPYTTYGLTNTNYVGVHITNTSTLNMNTTTVALNGQPITANYFQFLPSGGVTPPPNVISTNLYLFILKAAAVDSPPPLQDWRMVQIGTLAGQSAIRSP
jgi:Tfp pilus assembly protein FimT